MLLGKNDVIKDDEQGLTDGELVKAFRAGNIVDIRHNIVDICQFKCEIIRLTTTMDYAERMERDEQDMEFSANFAVYLRTIDSKLQHEFNGNNIRWGVADTYGHTRRAPQTGKYNDKGERNDTGGEAFQKCYRYNQRILHGAVGE